MTTMADFVAERERLRARWREKDRARRAALPVIHRVYEYLFPDGAVYIGVTRETRNRREYAHRRDMSVVGRRLVMFPDEEPVYTVLSEHTDRAEALAAERAAVLECPEGMRLNVVTPGGAEPMSPIADWKRRVKAGLEPAPPGGYL